MLPSRRRVISRDHRNGGLVLQAGPRKKAIASDVEDFPAVDVADAGAGLLAPFKRLTQVARPLPMLILGLGFLIAVPMAVFNIHLLVRGALWLIGGVAGLDIAHWQGVLSWHQPLYWIQVVAGATLLLEPFWLAAAVVEVRQARARTSGEDLRQWFGDLMTREGT